MIISFLSQHLHASLLSTNPLPVATQASSTVDAPTSVPTHNYGAIGPPPNSRRSSVPATGRCRGQRWKYDLCSWSGNFGGNCMYQLLTVFLITEERGPRCVVSVTHVSICLAAIGPIGAPSSRKTSWGKWELLLWGHCYCSEGLSSRLTDMAQLYDCSCLPLPAGLQWSGGRLRPMSSLPTALENTTTEFDPFSPSPSVPPPPHTPSSNVWKQSHPHHKWVQHGLRSRNVCCHSYK